MLNTKKTSVWLIALTLMVVLGTGLLIPAAANATVWFVDKDNTGSEDGLTWATAFNTIQEGINAAFAASGGEVWVAEGVYDEVRTSSPQGLGTGNIGSIIMKAGVALYGGFADTETARDQRDWATHITILDGATARDGLAAYHVIVGTSDGTLDGFIVSGGNANLSTIYTGDFRQYGGGMFNGVSSSPMVSNCTFTANNAGKGGGIYNRGSSSPTVTDCAFTANTAGRGGGMYNDRLSSPAVTNCTFSENVCGGGGGGMLNDRSSSPTLTNCVFWKNSNPTNNNSGGGMFNLPDSTPLLTNCTFSENWAKFGDGGIQNWSSSPTLTNCILWGNSHGAYTTAGDPAITYSIVQGGFPGTGNLDVDPLFFDAANGDLRIFLESPAVDSGTSTGAPIDDIRGVLRPQGLGWDMGAYEWTVGDPSSSITVTTTADVVDPSDGLISLREAIDISNWNGEPDTINFDASLAGQTISLTSLLPPLMEGNTTISGNGVITLDGSSLPSAYILQILESANNIIEGLTIIGGPYIGVEIGGYAAQNNIVRNCRIGTNGITSMGNWHGIMIVGGASQNLIGGTGPQDGNIISGNTHVGVYILDGSHLNIVQGNYIGTDATGTFSIPNSQGVRIRGGASDNLVGGPTPECRNIVSGNNTVGFRIREGGFNVVQGNFIGADVTGNAPLGNGGAGISIMAHSSNNLIGGIVPGEENVIAWNSRGIRVVQVETLKNQFRRNSIHDNLSQGIELRNGSNNGIAAPTITSLNPISGVAGPGDTVEIFADFQDEGEIYLDTVLADGTGAFQSSVAPIPGMNITATATDVDGNTSEFSETDTTPPVITLNGDAAITLELNVDSYTEEGAVATDNVDPNVAVVIGGDTVDVSAIGTYVVTYDATDESGNTAAQVTRTVTVEDTTPPDVTSAYASPDCLWPPNHKMHEVAVVVSATDNDGGTPTVTVASITNSESDDGWGDGETSNDIQVVDGVVFLRAERSGNGVGRLYTITLHVLDATGNATTVTSTVEVPHDASAHSCDSPDCDLNGQ